MKGAFPEVVGRSPSTPERSTVVWSVHAQPQFEKDRLLLSFFLFRKSRSDSDPHRAGHNTLLFTECLCLHIDQLHRYRFNVLIWYHIRLFKTRFGSLFPCRVRRLSSKRSKHTSPLSCRTASLRSSRARTLPLPDGPLSVRLPAIPPRTRRLVRQGCSGSGSRRQSSCGSCPGVRALRPGCTRRRTRW